MAKQKAKKNEAPDIWAEIRAWVYSRFGVAGLVLLAVLVFVACRWEIKSILDLLVDPLLNAFREAVLEPILQKPLPKADPNRFAVAVAHLENDQDGKVEGYLREALKNFEEKLGVQPLEFDRTIRLRGQPEEAERAGHQQAREYLKKSGAQVLVWGKVLAGGSARLYWTSSEEPGARRSERAYQPKDFALPDVHEKDLTDVLGLVVATQSAAFFAREGQFVGDQLGPFIERVRALLNSGAQGWNQETRAQVRFIFAIQLTTFAEQAGKNEPLEEAVAAFRETLKERTRERVPLDWAMTQNNLGAALETLGERESGTARLEGAVAAYREALKEWPRERVPLDWAATQNNLGNALWALGARASGTVQLEEAVAAYREALKEYTRERVPLDWATTQNNLGNALETLGERESGTARLEEAAVAYREALKEYTRERVPLDWAMTQNNLGNALETLGERESGT
ncbi:MAG: tetratricopeptide repeat protein, partial [Candidatus Binataceae bacterium]